MEENFDTYNLIIKYFKQEVTENELSELNSWLEKDKSHITTFNQIKDSWIYSDALRTEENTEEAFSKFNSSFLKPIERKTKKINLFFYKAATILLIFSTSIFLYLYMNSKSGETPVLAVERNQNIVEIPEGEKGRVTLPDGTKIWLNSGSKISYPATFSNKREVSFEGEGYFDVAKNQSIPFFVKTSDIIVKVTGTEFNLKSYPEDERVITALVEGSVEILDNNFPDKKALLLLNPNEVATFNKRERTIYLENLTNKKSVEENNMEISRVQKIEPTVETITSWKENHLIFDNETLEEMVKKMERWYGVDITLQAKNTEERYSGKFVYNEGIEQVLYVLSRTTPISYKINKNNVTITSK